MGMINAEQLRIYKAEENFEKALYEFSVIRSKRGQALVYIANGRLLRQWCQYRQSGEKLALGKEVTTKRTQEIDDDLLRAMWMLERAVKILLDLSNKPNLRDAYNELGNLHRHLGDYDKSIQYFKEALQLSQSLGDDSNSIDIIQETANVYYLMKDFLQAEELAEQARSQAFKRKDYYIFARAHRILGDIYFNRGQFDRAFESVFYACSHVLRLDANIFLMTSSRRYILYDLCEDWATNLLLELPSDELAKKWSEYLISKWMGARFGKIKLHEYSPGFEVKMQAIFENYSFLRAGLSEEK